MQRSMLPVTGKLLSGNMNVSFSASLLSERTTRSAIGTARRDLLFRCDFRAHDRFTIEPNDTTLSSSTITRLRLITIARSIRSMLRDRPRDRFYSRGLLADVSRDTSNGIEDRKRGGGGRGTPSTWMKFLPDEERKLEETKKMRRR